LAAVTPILRALAIVARRDLRTFLSVGTNNFFLFGVLLTYSALVGGAKPVDAMPVFLFLLLLMLFPLTSDPLTRIPPSRIELWPLKGRERFALRVFSLALTPIVWVPLLVVAVTARLWLAISFLGMVLGIQALAIAGNQLGKRVPSLNPLRSLPQLPGSVGGIIRLSIRQILSVLDFYLALTLCIGMTTYRFTHADSRAYPIEALFLAFTLSTYAQSSFGLDSRSTLTRYQLMPLRGWQILLAKDAAFLCVVFALVLPLNASAGLTFGLAAVALGRYPSLSLWLPQYRWRFIGGDVRFSILQAVVGAGLGFEEYRRGAWFFAIALAAYLLSLYVGGIYWDRGVEGRRVAAAIWTNTV
jgi:hypothetical protein